MTQAKRIATRTLLRTLGELYPEAFCSLHFENPLQLLIATILSAQCTDKRVNLVTPALFARFPEAADYANGDLAEIKSLVSSTGFYHNKAKNIQLACQQIVTLHGGQVPQTLEELVELPGVGRKTANVVLGDGFGTPGITVDTHVGRLSRRMGLTVHENPVKAEQDLMALIPRPQWTPFSHRMILHGRAVCESRKPKCSECQFLRVCPRIGVADTIPTPTIKKT